MSENLDGLTPAQLVNRVREIHNMTWDEMGEMMGRSGRMLRKIARGETSGESYRIALTELGETGSVQHPVARRRGRDGHVVPVRAKAGAEAPTVVPDDDKARIVRTPKRGKFSVSHPTDADAEKHITLFAEGNRVVEVNMPKTARAKGRTRGLAEIKNQIRRVTKGQARQDKRVKLQVTFDTGDGHGRVMTIGSKSGYHASDVLGDIKSDFGGDFESWIRHHANDRYDDLDLKKSPVVNVTLVVFDAHRTKPERQQQDFDRTRRRRWKRR